MFNNTNNKESKTTSRIETLIGENCSIIGNINGEGLIKIDGTVDGDINWLDDLIIGDKCNCSGNITCKNATIQGSVKGNVICEENLVIEPHGKISGDITVKKFIVKEGGSLEGKCTMIMEKSLALKEILD